jgi:hypothetical protein
MASHGAGLEDFRAGDLVATVRAFAQQHGQGDLGALQAFSASISWLGAGLQAFGLLELVLAVDPELRRRWLRSSICRVRLRSSMARSRTMCACPRSL